MKIHSAAKLAPELVLRAFNRGFEGYFLPVEHTADSLALMVEDNDIALDHSLVLLDADEAPAGVALLGVRSNRGWVGGMGIAPVYRGQGQGEALMRALVAEARSCGLHTLQLEVLSQNAVARRLYTRLGFRTTRPLHIYAGSAVAPSGLVAPDGSIGELAADEALSAYPELRHASLAWQRQPESLRHMGDRLTRMMISDARGPRSALTFRIVHDTQLLALDLSSRSPSLAEQVADGAALIQAATRSMSEPQLRVLNAPPDDPLGTIARAFGCVEIMSQDEMTLRLV